MFAIIFTAVFFACLLAACLCVVVILGPMEKRG